MAADEYADFRDFEDLIIDAAFDDFGKFHSLSFENVVSLEFSGRIAWGLF